MVGNVGGCVEAGLITITDDTIGTDSKASEIPTGHRAAAFGQRVHTAPQTRTFEGMLLSRRDPRTGGLL
ncbi:hypothetical protein B0I08_10669 [Glaciihabitans tibetensis]|uniref:Uncharacterized protein n=2 Tax=Glaciihabitans tibetensis TaxID=1266600 RepID=A0A2T0VBA3_9MICO|nr:hypothetical protein B0I08_10669 [Glaciihabitans tibetensis]